MRKVREEIESRVNDDDWKIMSRHAGIGINELKEKVIKELEELYHQKQLQPSPPRNPNREPCNTISFDFDIYEIVGVAGDLTLCGDSSSDWTATLVVSLVVSGVKVWTSSHTFNTHDLRICFHPSIGLVEAKLCFTVCPEGKEICLNAETEVCILWSCGSVKQGIFCIPLP